MLYKCKKLKLSAISFCMLFAIGSFSALLSGCDNNNDPGHSDDSPPTPPTPPTPPEPPTPPASILPEAKNVNVKMLYTNSRLRGGYVYSDENSRKEGNSLRRWLNEEGAVVGDGELLDISSDFYNKTVRFCVTPVTYDAVKGKEECSIPLHLSFDSKSVNFSTDWKTDTDYINDTAYGDVRNGPSGNIHFYYNINISPILPDSYDLGLLAVEQENAISRVFSDGYNLDDIYAAIDNSNQITLVNNTSRSIREPLLRINDDYYYRVAQYVLKPFSEVTLSGYAGGPVTNIAFIDPNPAFKLNVNGFWQGDTIEQIVRTTPIITESLVKLTKDKKTITREDILNSIKSLVQDSPSEYAPVSQLQAQQYVHTINLSKILYNRFDLIKLFFDSMNAYQGLDGSALARPYDDVSAGACGTSLTEGHIQGGNTPGTNACGQNNVVAPLSYRLRALSRLVSHEPDTLFKYLIRDDIASGRSDIFPTNTPGTLGIMYFGDTLADIPVGVIATIAHESGHRMGYSDSSGMTYGWADDTNDSPAISFLTNMDFYHKTPTGGTDATQAVEEKTDFFADYHWIDNKTVDVTFYSKGNTQPIRNIAVLAEDEESGRTFPNFFGTWDTCESPEWTDVSDCPTWVSTNWDGSLRLAPEVDVINNYTIRIKLAEPLENYSRTIRIFASSADSNFDTGAWKTGYQQSTGDSFSIQIPYDQEMIMPDAEHSIAYIISLNDFNIVRGGSTGHLGENGKRGVTAPNYFLDSSYYRGFKEDAAIQHCKDLGYQGLGKIPLPAGSSASDPLGNLIYKYVYDGTMIGLDNANGATPVIIKGKTSNSHPISTVGDIMKDSANIIVCGQ